MRNSCSLLVCALVLVASTAVAAGLPRDSGSGWRLSAVVTSDGDRSGKQPERVLRMGLKNIFQTARLICVAGWSYTVEHPQRNSTRGEGGAHSCTTAQSSTLVLPGETLFVSIPSEPLDLHFETAALVVHLLVLESRLESTDSPTQVTLTWNGKVKEAVTVGRQLAKH